MRIPVVVHDGPKLKVPISSGIITAGRLLFVSGAGPVRPDGSFLLGDFEAQARLTFANLTRVVESAGGRMDQVVKAQAWLRDMADFPTFNGVWSEIFSEPRPARTTVQSNLPGFDIEVDLIVALDAGPGQGE